MYQQLLETYVGFVGYCNWVPVSLVQCSVGGGNVGVAVQIGGVGVGGADVGGASVGGAYVSPTIHVISKLLCSQLALPVKLMYISPPLLLLTAIISLPIRNR